MSTLTSENHSIRICILTICFLICLEITNAKIVNASTYQKDSKLFSKSSPGLTSEQKLNFQVGRGLFKRLWVTAPASTQTSDGLGPLYNARSCMGCHPNNGRSQPGNDAQQIVIRIDVPPQNDIQHEELTNHKISNIPEPTYGLQLQNLAIAGHNSEYQELTIIYEETPITLSDNTQVMLRKPNYQVAGLAYGAMHPETRMSPRVAPQIIGLGLLEAINEKDILSQADPEDHDGDGISGRPNWVWSHALTKVSLGRFGLKSEKPTLDDQVQSAFSIDIGLSVPLHTNAAGDCTAKQSTCLTAVNGNTPRYDNLEVHQEMIDLVNLYVNHIDVPPQRNATEATVLAGKKLFNEIGCASCHTPRYVTGNQSPAKANHNKEIFPYTDLLLHDMGEGLADHRPEGVANGREWRTAPLWGIGLTQRVSGHNYYLHDGRARSLLEAILWHGGEAQLQRNAVIALDKESREQLLAFIKSL